MSCERHLDLIDDLIEGELDAPSAAQVNLHIFACSECAVKYEILKKEKAMYARYLFEIEPPNRLSARFQAKMNLRPLDISQTVGTSPLISGWKARINGFIPLSPALAAAVLLAAFGLGLGFLKYASNKPVAENEYAAETNPFYSQMPATKSSEIDKDEAKIFPAKALNEKPAISKSAEQNKAAGFVNIKKTARYGVKAVLVKSGKTKNPAIRASGKGDFPTEAQITEEKFQNLRLKNLETETAEQIEKIEMLLRAFRNTRSVEGGETFDVAYEKRLAGKLLEKNIRLRRGAEDYGTADAEEILGKAEPFLLDISNLENDAAPEKILDIKERVKNQNIIASLQIY